MTVPHAYVENAIDWEITEYELGTYGVVPVDGSGPIDWTEYSDSDWRVATVRGEVTVQEKIFDVVLPDDDSPADTLVSVQFESKDTQYVTRTEVEGPLTPGSTEQWEIELEHSKLHGQIDVRPFLVRAEDRDDPTPFFGSFSRQRLADGPVREIRLDGDSGRGLNAEFVNFEEDLPGVHGDILYYVGGDNEEPTVYANERFDHICEVLDADGFWHFSPLMRDTIAHWIAQSVVYQYALWAGADAAANGATDDDETGDDPLNYDWQRNILASLGPELCETDDPTEVARDLASKLEDPTDIPALLRDLSQAVQREVPAQEPLETYIEYEGPDSIGGDDE